MSDNKSKITLQQFGFQESTYERPNQKWACGRLAEGCPCHLGPNNKGECLATFECSPNKTGDRWNCTRPANRGGKCETGPSPDGTCCKAVPKCQPVRNIRSKRGVFVAWCVALTVGFLAIMLFSPSRMEFVQPGELSHVHGQVFKDATAGQACAKCHSAAHSDDKEFANDGSLPDQWARLAFNGSSNVSENSKCLDCHSRHPGLKENANYAHSFDPEMLKQASAKEATGSQPLRWMFASIGPDVPKGSGGTLACATCHKEHRGQHHNLAAIDNQACQSCHQQKFTSFSDGHPEFKGFPYDRRPRLKFDHSRHEEMHFPGSKTAFSCAQCHRVDASSEHMNVRSFEQACSKCHGDSLRKFDKGVPVFRLPGLDLETLTEFAEAKAENPWLGPWPPKADYGMNLPRLTPFMKLLLSADKEVVVAMDSLPPKFDLGDLTEATDEQKKAVVRIGWGVKELMFELSRNGQEALRSRLQTVLGEEINNDRLAELTGQVPASLLVSAQQKWFPELIANVPVYRNGDPIDGRPAVKPPKPPTPPDAKPDLTNDALSDDDLFGDDSDDEPDKPVDDALFDDDAGDQGAAEDTPTKTPPLDDSLFNEDPPKKDGGDDLFNDDPPKKDGGDDLFNDDPPAKDGGDDLFNDDGGGDDLFNDDGGDPPPVKDEAPKIEAKTIKPLPIEQRVPGGGWYIDEKDFALRFTPMGHGNPFLRQWLTSTADASGASNASNTKLISDMFNTISTSMGAACMKCHSVDGTSEVARTVNWKTKSPNASDRGFVKFSHRPHLNVAELSDCKSCHQFEGQDLAARYAGLDPHKVTEGQIGFKFVTKQSCANCHQPKLAGDSCTKCHNYHIGEAPRWRKMKPPSVTGPAPVAIDARFHHKETAKQDDHGQGE